tara:strand:+ start:5864 stop:6061 length:198 start_codon:yes stop_codon:yes gene_type:complete
MQKFHIYPNGTIEDESGKEVFKSSVSQQDAREVIYETISENGYVVDEEWEMDDDSIELTVKKVTQ